MAIIKCKMCGGDIELSPDKTFGTCEYCGSTMTLPKIDDDQRAAAFNRGNHFRRIGEFDKALAVYERIVQEDNTDAEAHWCCALCRFGIEYVEDPATYEWLPTCHRASFDNFLEDVDYLAALEHSDGITRRQYQKDGTKIAEVQKGILATSQNEAPFDVFLCYKESDDSGNRTVDSTLAQDIYYQLTEQGRRVFFSRITLEDKAGAQYEPYIFAALNSAKVMVAVGTKPEYFNAVWVKNEWSRFLALMKKERNKLLIPCYRDMDPYDLPEQLSILQSYDMSKIGFIQDLIRGVAKVLDANKTEPTPVRETVVVQSEGGGNLTALIKRGNMALEDKDWDKADGFFDRALDIDAECAEAFFGKLLAEQKCASASELIQKRQRHEIRPKSQTLTACPEDNDQINAAVQKYEISGYLTKERIIDCFRGYMRTYNSTAMAWRTLLEDEITFWNQDKLAGRAVRYAKGSYAEQVQSIRDAILEVLRKKVEEQELADKAKVKEVTDEYKHCLSKAELGVKALHENALELRETDYKIACARMEEAKTKSQFSAASQDFLRLGDYKDSKDRTKQCSEKMAAEKERERKEAEAEKERRRALKKQAEEEAEARAKAEAEAKEKAEAEEAKKRRIEKNIRAICAVAMAVAVIAFCIWQTHINEARAEQIAEDLVGKTFSHSEISSGRGLSTTTISGEFFSDGKVSYEKKYLPSGEHSTNTYTYTVHVGLFGSLKVTFGGTEYDLELYKDEPVEIRPSKGGSSIRLH